MTKRIWVGCLIGLSIMASASGQPATDSQRRYKAAVRLVQTGDYERAKGELNAVIQRGGPVAPYAHYYYALAAYRQKKFDQARLMLRQLTERFPDWPKQPDATYLLGISQLEEGRYEDGLRTLDELKDPALRSDAARAEQAILSRATDLRALKQLNRNFPDNRIVGQALIELIQRSSSDRDDLELSDELTNRFGVPGTVTPRLTPMTSASATAQTPPSRTNRPAGTAVARPNRAKSGYTVAVMLPFRVEDFANGKRSRSNQYVYDLYNGMLLAKAKLQEEGITVNLQAYDLDNDPNKTLELLNNPAFAQTDLIVGPLYVEPNRIASAWANQNGIILLNPIATSSDLITDQPMSFLAQASLARQAEQVAGQAHSINSLRRAAIYFGSTRKDSLLAAAYRDELLQQRYQVVDFRKMGPTAQATAASLFKPVAPTIRPGTVMSGATQPAGTSSAAPVSAPVPAIGHVFLSSSNDDDGPRLQEALSSRRVNAPLLATASAFDMYKDGTSTFSRRDLYLLYPDYISPDRDVVSTFNQTYLAERNTIPSVFASEGYDMLLFFGRQLAKNNGLRNRDAMRSDTDDYLLSGFDYTQSNDNQIVPIVKFDGGRFIKIN
ncbi:amino acid/amide ABC transporter substrate-binding protein (HAAT family) [Spirosoma oryzae]|uniref:Amino acid/amide ABC transporter substrate-binding protein (HAAT family) n=1 Tax=Spirosoma oryzae TaxID=1469603 RepID=A0A2T0SM34_9BACT|nr:tetratricopeptide repeat protein [Spirosoma oryzae]PRY34433.1 amino acid/amide ABC transporter substrate-binding protein (HAAT family) [Spirosoma oryzae]